MNQAVNSSCASNEADLVYKATSASSPKPPPIFVTGIKNITAFDKFLEENSLHECERKTFASQEVKIQPKTADDYRKFKYLLDHQSADDAHGTLGKLQYHTYQLKSEKSLHPTSQFGHETRRVTNVQIRRKIDDKNTTINLPLFRIELEPKKNNKSWATRKHIGLVSRLNAKAYENDLSTRMLLSNVNGLLPRKKELENFLHQENIDIAVVTETHFTSRFHLNQMRGYTIHSCNHPSGKAQGGSAVIVKNRLQYSVEQSFSTPSIQAACISIHLHHTTT